MASLVTDVVKKVQEHEPNTLLYYAFHVKEKNEIVIIERWDNILKPCRLLYLGISSSPVSHQWWKILIKICRYKDPQAVKAHVKAPYFQEFAAKIPSLSAKPWELRAGAFVGGVRGVSRLWRIRYK